MRPITGDASCQNYLSLLVAAPRGESCSAPPGATGAIAVVNDGTVIRRSKRRERSEATVTRLRPISPWLLLLAVVVIVATHLDQYQEPVPQLLIRARGRVAGQRDHLPRYRTCRAELLDGRAARRSK